MISQSSIVMKKYIIMIHVGTVYTTCYQDPAKRGISCWIAICGCEFGSMQMLCNCMYGVSLLMTFIS